MEAENLKKQKKKKKQSQNQHYPQIHSKKHLGIFLSFTHHMYQKSQTNRIPLITLNLTSLRFIIDSSK